MTIAEALNISALQLKTVDDDRLMARALLSFVLKKPETFIFSHPEYALEMDEYDLFVQLLSRAKNHEPLSYLTGHKEFYGLDFVVTPDVLIPRPETEELVSKALHFAKSRLSSTENTEALHNPLQIVDVGTGSGCVALSIAKHLSDAQIYAIDVSLEALKVAKINKSRLKVTNVTLLNDSLLEPLQGLVEAHSIDIIVANLPYISDFEYDTLPATVRDYEPSLALKSGSDADVLNRQLIEQSKNWLKPGGLLVYETTNGQIVESRL